MKSATRRFAAAVLVAAAAASCTSIAPPTSSGPAVPEQSVCAGISSQLGGCSRERHAFRSTTCPALATEWAEVLDRAIVAILNEPPEVGGNARSVRLRQALVVITSDMNTRLRELNLNAGCDVPEFLAAAEPQFSAALRDGVGDSLFDGNPVMTYRDWLDDVTKVVRVIDDGE